MRITSRYDAKCRECGAAIAAGDPCDRQQGNGVRCVKCARKSPAPPSTVTAYLATPDPGDDQVANAQAWAAIRNITHRLDGVRPRPTWSDPMRGVTECRPHRGVIYRAGDRCLFCASGYPAFKEPPAKRGPARQPDLFMGA